LKFILKCETFGLNLRVRLIKFVSFVLEFSLERRFESFNVALHLRLRQLVLIVALRNRFIIFDCFFNVLLQYLVLFLQSSELHSL